MSRDDGVNRSVVSLASLRGGDDVWTSTGVTITHCRGQPTRQADLHTLREAAAGFVAYLQVREARETLERLDAILQCMNEPVDPGLLSELFLLKGYLAMLEGNASGASPEFEAAVAVQPDLEWNSNYNPDFGADLLASIRTASRVEAQLRMVPGGEGSTVTIHGRSDGRLRRGRNFVQVSTSTTRSFWLTVQDVSDEVLLVIPSMLSSESLADPEDAAVQGTWFDIAATSASAGGVVEVMVGERVYRILPGERDWTEVARLKAARGGAYPALRTRLGWFVPAGAAMLAGGAVLAVASAQATDLEGLAREDMLTPAAAEANRVRVNRNVWVGYGLVATGATTAGVGMLVMRGGADGGTVEWVVTR